MRCWAFKVARYIFIDGGVGTICVGIYAAVFKSKPIVVYTGLL